MSNPSPTVDPKPKNDSFWLYGGGLLLLVAGFWLAYQFVDPAPPKQLLIATGSPQNAYYRNAERYAERLAHEGIKLDILSTAGSVENLQKLVDGTVDIALVQGGIDHPQHERLRSLGSLYFEPLWLFHRQDQPLSRLTELSGKRIAVGAPGSGTRPVAMALLDNNGISAENSELLPLSSEQAAIGLIDGSVDALFLVTSAGSTLVQQLLASPEIELMSFTRAGAYRSKHEFLSSVTLPEGVFDLVNNIPNRSIELLAPAATLVVRNDFHPALAGLMLQIVSQVHGQGGLFEQPGEFPSSRYAQFQLSEDAQRYFRSGPPFLQRFLPFWAANLIDRLVVMLIPIVTLMIPLSKILPPTYRWRVRSRIYRWYDQIRDLDFRTEQVNEREEAMALRQELHAVEREIMQVPVPKSYAENQYNLRVHLRLIDDRLQQKIEQAQTHSKPDNTHHFS